MRSKILSTLLFYVALFSALPLINAQLSFSHNYLLGRGDNPVQSKYSPDWEKLKSYDFYKSMPAPMPSFPRLEVVSKDNYYRYTNFTFAFVKSFIQEPHNYGDYIDKDEEIHPFLLSYGILGNGNYNREIRYSNSGMIDTLFTHFTKKENATTLLGYMKPICTKALSYMSEGTRSAYKSILPETIAYIKELSTDSFYEKELAYCKSKADFTHNNSDGVIDRYRKAKAFVFRRYIDFKAKSWNSAQLQEFREATGYMPKPKWGMNLVDMEGYCNSILGWF